MGIPRCRVIGVLGRFWHKDLESWVAALAGSQHYQPAPCLCLCTGLSWVCCPTTQPHLSFTCPALSRRKVSWFLPSASQFQIYRKRIYRTGIRWLPVPQLAVARRPEHIPQDGYGGGSGWSGHCELGKCSEEVPLSMKLEREVSPRDSQTPLDCRSWL